MNATPLIVGFGRAGRELHLHCLRRLANTGALAIDASVVHAVDKQATGPTHRHADGVILHRTLEAAADVVPSSAVVHICTGPDTHFEVLARAARLGFRRFIIEKPMAATAADAARIADLVDRDGLDVVVVANWLSSALTASLMETIATRPADRPLGSIVMRQTKSRLSRAGGEGHSSAFDIEMPHLVALALHMAGQDAELVAASCADIRVGDRLHRDLGQAFMETSHGGGLRCQLYTDLACPLRERSIEFRTMSGMIRGYFPADGSDSFSYLFQLDERGVVRKRQLIADDPLSSFLLQSYRYFQGRGPRPVSDVAFNRRAVALLDAAKASCSIRRQAGADEAEQRANSEMRINELAEV